METIEDIVREMREGVKDAHGNRVGIYDDYADRIEAAYMQQLTKGEMCTMSCRESGALLEQYAESEKRLVEEVKRLKAALNSAQRIYSEGAK